MRSLITLLFMLSSMQVVAMPEYLKGAKVTVTLENGKTYTYNSEDMAVVKRKNLNVNKHTETEMRLAKKVLRQVKDKKLVKNRKNRVYILGGYGSTGNLNVSTDGNTYETKHDKGVVGGVGYQRKLNEKFNVGVQVQTNGTGSLSVGRDF